MVSRIKQLLDWQQLSPTQFADRIGIGRPVISHILSERNKPSLDVMQRILTAFPELSTDWLIKGDGEMLAASVPAALPPPVAPSEVIPAAAAPVVSAAPFRPAAAPAPQTAAATLLSAAPVAVIRPVEPEYVAPAPKAAPRPAIARFSPTKIGATPLSPPAEQAAPAEQAPAADLTGPTPQLADASVITLPDELPTQIATPAAAVSSPAAPKAVPSLADVFGEPGKAIRRIVIFYRDGSFADYQPEG